MPTKIYVEMTFTSELLGTASNNPELHADYIASKAPDAPSREEEVAAIGTVEYEEKGMTVFPRNDKGEPVLWNYQVEGFFKESEQMLGRSDSHTKMKAFKKVIDGGIKVYPRQIVLELPPRGFVGDLQRPLRAQTAQGERVALAHSETCPVGTKCKFVVDVKNRANTPWVIEWLEYGAEHGMGQWRNAGNGRFTYRAVDVDTGEVLGDNSARDVDADALDIIAQMSGK